jgi:hypothetical protein
VAFRLFGFFWTILYVKTQSWCHNNASEEYIDSRRGLCNETRLVIKQLRQNVIVAVISSEKNKGICVFIPKNENVPNRFRSAVHIKQTAISCATFAVTINKSQGQTFDRVGILLQEPVFSHGQLYVTFSRAISREEVKVVCIEGANAQQIYNNKRPLKGFHTQYCV